VSEHGAAPLCWSVAHIGPLAATARDAAIGYLTMAGPDPLDPHSTRQPPPDLDGFADRDLRGVTLGIYRPWFEDADPAIVTACHRVLEGLQEAGATVREVVIEDLETVRIAHLITIAVEMATSQQLWFDRHAADYGLDVRLNLLLARHLPSTDYVHAQRHRARIVERLLSVLTEVDAICSPTTACTAPPLPKDALQTGESNLELLGRIMRYAPAANLSGLPAISFPAGYDAFGLPIGFQAMGRPWRESLLLRLAHVAEGFVERKKPQRYHAPF
jgi:Asp-tRNA(Asn)/Glu-tRNA(Gln) amidotransferase A subunit family amidase